MTAFNYGDIIFQLLMFIMLAGFGVTLFVVIKTIINSRKLRQQQQEQLDRIENMLQDKSDTRA